MSAVSSFLEKPVNVKTMDIVKKIKSLGLTKKRAGGVRLVCFGFFPHLFTSAKRDFLTLEIACN